MGDGDGARCDSVGDSTGLRTSGGYPPRHITKQALPGSTPGDGLQASAQRVAFTAMADSNPNDATLGYADHFEVIVPLRTRYASTVRIIAASLGAEAGFTIDEIDDLRLGLDEVFSLLAERHAGDRVRTTFRIDGKELTAVLALETGPIDVRPDELAANILRSVVDHCEFTDDSVTLRKVAVEQ
jgi:serine/threonine-protein kinase RsbW